jgi:hypothetical protein
MVATFLQQRQGHGGYDVLVRVGNRLMRRATRPEAVEAVARRVERVAQSPEGSKLAELRVGSAS